MAVVWMGMGWLRGWGCGGVAVGGWEERLCGRGGSSGGHSGGNCQVTMFVAVVMWGLVVVLEKGV